MEIRELRIGNWYEWHGKQSQITLSDFIEEYETGQSFFHKHPIPLTEEWLVKFGFEWSIAHQAHHLEGFAYVIDICQLYCRVIKYKRNGEVLTSIKHVHQLQNLYFALTGEELTEK